MLQESRLIEKKATKTQNEGHLFSASLRSAKNLVAHYIFRSPTISHPPFVRNSLCSETNYKSAVLLNSTNQIK